jgi:hypothetical protein
MKIAEDVLINTDHIQSTGFEIKDFLELHMLCEICQDIVSEPVECGACKKSFCKACIDRWLGD